MSGPHFNNDVMDHLEHIDFGPIVYSLSTENIVPSNLSGSSQDEQKNRISFYFSHARSELEILLDALNSNKEGKMLEFQKIRLQKQRNFVLAHNLALSYGLLASVLASKAVKNSTSAALHNKLIATAKSLIADGWFFTPSNISFTGNDAFFLIDYSHIKCGSEHSPNHKYAKLAIDTLSNEVVLKEIPPLHLENRRLNISITDSSMGLQHSFERQVDGGEIPPTDNRELPPTENGKISSTDFNTKLLRARRYLLDEEIYTRVFDGFNC
ncbi:hypothetical protein DI09_60p150 [Mitosporidium daphniae]|uniref:Uncharacterized protein n=1 Tax=Mitosporidium daphniae TaxID=1485682 RepID=A0A098VNL4_9MICR|nr:uncharacterized protein DI09_60p150 [Mitosporidium daphniae]KGG50648.1 hypothetical protein DI09_60p150 [Mitosporidium daphniae]|eukprot:XP_013237075.1 uncharacterized protein DI09_60p150 [Mitosporidium daphniae]